MKTLPMKIIVDNLFGRQLAANAEAVFNDGHRTTENDGEV